MWVLAAVTAAALLISTIANRKKTWEGIKKGLRMLLSLAFPFLSVLIVVSLALMFLTPETIARLLGGAGEGWAVAAAAAVGSVTLIPGFVAFPLCALLLQMGAAYSVVAVFLTTLMMVGVVTLPLEAKYFGWKTALLRNALSLAAAVVVGLGIGLAWNLV